MKKYYSFAGVEVEIDIPAPWMYENERHLAPFGVTSVEDPYVFQFELVEQIMPPKSECVFHSSGMQVYADGVRYHGSVAESWDMAYAQILRSGRHHRVLLDKSQCPGKVGVSAVLTALSAEHLVAQNHGFVFHSSYIEVGGKAILFTAPSQTGKSTQADLWQKLRDARIINGDRSAVRWVKDGAYACGIPFSGSSTYCENVTLPLAAIVYLKQAPQTTIRRVKGSEAFRKVWEGCSVNTWDRDDVDMVSETVIQVLSAVPVYELACTPDESAIIALEGVLPHE